MIFIKQQIKYFFVAYLLQIAIYTHAQSLNYKHYGVEQGLPSSEVYQVFQDSKGYIWFATDMGISRFNGSEFTNFDIENGLANSTVFEIFEDHHGKIWFLSLLNKLSYYDEDTIIQYRYNKIIEEHSQKNIIPVKRSFFIDSLNNVYISVRSEGIFKLSNKGEYTNLQKNDTNSTLRIVEISNKLLVGYKYKGTISEHIIYKNIAVSIRNNQIKKNKSIKSKMYFTEYDLDNKTILIATNENIFRINLDKLSKLKTFNNDILWFSKDKHNRYWVSIRDNGIFCFEGYDFSTKNSQHFLKKQNVSSVLIDKDDGYWFSTLNNGVYYLPTFELKTIIETIDKNICNISESPQNLLVSMLKSEFLVFNKKCNFIKKIKTGTNNLVHKIVYDQEKDIFLIITNRFFKKISPNQIKHTTELSSKNISTSEINAKTVALSIEPDIWFSNTSGLFRAKDGRIVYSSEKENQWHELIYSIIANPNGSLWLGTLKGLWKYKNGEYIYYGNQNSFFKHRTNALLKHKNKLFIGTKGAGLIIYNLKNESITVLNNHDGLTSNSITSIAKYDNKIYVGTNKGLNILSIKDKGNYKIQQFDKGNGLLSDEINKLYTYDSVLYIVGKKGVNYINLKQFNLQNKILNTYIEKVRIGTIDTLVKESYELNYKQNFINISYKGVTFNNSQNILYRYKMHPIVTDWTYTNKNELQFTSLNPGTYKFEISAKNKSGEWNQTNTTLSFVIKTPFWQNWWVINSIMASLIILIIIIINNRLNRVRKENRLKKELNLYMKKAINSQINPHFLFNSLNSINQYILKNDKLSSSKYLNRFSIYIRSILNALKNDFQSLSEELKISELYLELEKFRLKEKLSYNLKIDKSVKSRNVLIPTMIITPFLENAIWFGILPQKGQGKIEILISQENTTLTISICDNGIGRIESLKQQNNPDFNLKNPGSENAMERIKLLNDLYSDKIDINYIDKEEADGACGTIVNITVEVNIGGNGK